MNVADAAIGQRGDDGGKHRTALDGLCALAIVSVMLFHAGCPGFRSGWIGVDLFFVLSGFLITTLLAMESSASGTIGYWRFMARRALRLMPAYVLYAVFITVLLWGAAWSVRTENGGWTATGLTTALWTYTINYVPQGGVWNGQDLTIHLWSLSVEQQYYLVWPLLFLALHKRSTALTWVASGLALAAILSFVLAPYGLYKNNLLYTRGFSLVLASALALHVYYRPGILAGVGVNRLVDILGGLLLIALFAAPYKRWWADDRIREVLLPVLVPIFGWWVARLWTVQSGSKIREILRSRSLVYIGKISYGVYLCHEAVRIGVWSVMKPLMSDWSPAVGFVVRLAIYLLLSFALAALSYECLEKRFLRFTGRFRPFRSGATKP
jgi:peptidoglycan/LPS O-acetylase OafA/YrhL